jgi:hypothetical protein
MTTRGNYTVDELVEEFALYADTKELSNRLLAIGRKGQGEELTSAEKYFIMEARDNILGLYSLCKDFVAAEKARKRAEDGTQTS